MESRKSIHLPKRMESSLNASPASSSPLRKSIIAQKQLSNVLSENDDEAERIARRREICTPNAVTSTGSNKRHSLSLGFLANIPTLQMAESINQCIKLCAENKINIRNAFSLEMIDFMTYMIKKQDNNMSNLQIASTSLDVSSKIYGFRVDSVHTEILKIIGGLEKQAPEGAEQDQDNQEEAPQENVNADPEASKKKKKKRVRQICNTVEALRSNVETLKPLSMMIGEGDLQTSDMLYQATLPNHANSGFYQHLYNDVLVDVVVEEQNNVNSTQYATLMVEDFQDLEICAAYSNFEFLGWSVEDEPENTSNVQHDDDDDDDEADNRFQFDLEASMEHESENPPLELVNYFDIEMQDDIRACERQQRQVATNHAENIVDAPTMSSNLVVTSSSEYSFVSSTATLHWAGPSHWKFHNFAKPPVGIVAGGKVIGACMQAPLRKRKEIELSYKENKDVLDAKFGLSQSNKLQAKTAKTEWSAESLILPEDVHYDITLTTKMYLHQYLSIKSQENGDKTTAADVSDNDRYDYNNPNDTSEYCPDVCNGDYDEVKDNNENECNFEFEDDSNALASSQGFTGDNLIAAPKLANKISIAYCLKAKKIDMRQLKKSIWKCLKSTNNADMTDIAEASEKTEVSTIKEAKHFNDVYKMLPRLLTKNNAEALSVPLFFISMLHLANEKTLNMCSLPDMSDIIVERD